ncbi:protein FD-like [Salvia splendens]|uniref:protein FD-like n=1 Tax=Salvia splendens TaxID=180675 RepID=UPI001C26A032|nr:protein FD-like [Salvia splendens]
MSSEVLLQMWTASSSASASASASTSASSSPSPYLHHPKTMEEVWKDITFAASDLHLNPSSPRGLILQDFFSKAPPPSSVPSHASPPPPPPTMLTLSSSAAAALLFQPHCHPAALDAVVPDDSAAGKKRFPDFERNSGDRRHKRMIKNRESAARSRARKQAYTNELELEVAHLLEENAKLRKQQEKFYREAAAEHQKRKPLHRTSTAPF